MRFAISGVAAVGSFMLLSKLTRKRVSSIGSEPIVQTHYTLQNTQLLGRLVREPIHIEGSEKKEYKKDKHSETVILLAAHTTEGFGVAH